MGNIKPTEGGNTRPRTRSKAGVSGLEGILDGLEEHNNFLQYEDSQEAHDKLVLAICWEFVEVDGDGVVEVGDKRMKRLEQASRIFTVLRGPRNGSAQLLFGDSVCYSEEAQEALEDLHARICWELCDRTEGLESFDEDEGDYLESVTEIYRRMRC